MRGWRGLVAFVPLLAATPAAASEWILLSELVGTNRIDYVDRESLRVADGQAEALLYAVFIDDAPSGMAAMEVRYRFDCRQSRGRMLFARTFDASQRVRSEGALREEWEEIRAPSFLVVFRTYACSNGASPSGTSMGSAHPFEATRRSLRENRDEARAREARR